MLFRLIEELGTRRNEAMSLTWNQVDFRKRQITVSAEGSKGRRYRTLPMSEELVAALAEWMPAEASGTDAVLPWELNMIRRFYVDWDAIVEAAGLPPGTKLVPKNLRSTCGSELIEAGCQPWW